MLYKLFSQPTLNASQSVDQAGFGPGYPTTDHLFTFFDATVTPSLLCASGTTMTEDMKKKLQTIQWRMMRMIMQTKRKSGKRPAAAHAANVEEVADDEPHDADYEPEEDTTEISPQDFQRARRKRPRR